MVPSRMKITFSNMCWSVNYRPIIELLRNISLTLEKGENERRLKFSRSISRNFKTFILKHNCHFEGKIITGVNSCFLELTLYMILLIFVKKNL